MPSDFNGDGYADLAVGVPLEKVGGHFGAGAVNVLYGSGNGLTAVRGSASGARTAPGSKVSARGKLDGSL